MTGTPVVVSCGMLVICPPETLVMLAGGQAHDVTTSSPAPAPPVCQAASEPSQALLLMPIEAQKPSAARGSLGAQPSASPSW